MVNQILSFLSSPVESKPLKRYRIVFSLILLCTYLISIYKSEIEHRYTDAIFHFKYPFFEWIPYPGPEGIYLLYGLAILAAFALLFGVFYQISVLLSFLVLSFLHGIDASNYINHYYLLELLLFILFFIPLGENYAGLNKIGIKEKVQRQVPYFYLFALQLQIGIVYFFAGLAKLNQEWLLHAMPLQYWFHQISTENWIQSYLTIPGVAAVASIFAVIYDLSIFFLLFWNRTKPFAFALVIFFHGLTSILFDIGMFPWIMMGSLLLFCKENRQEFGGTCQSELFSKNSKIKFISFIFIFHFVIQILVPNRHIFLGLKDISWSQIHFRYGWRVMLVEHEGSATFRIQENENKKRIWEIDPADYLTDYQYKRMAVQPEHIRQFAHYLARQFRKKYGVKNLSVYADVFVSIHGKASQRLVDSQVDLARENYKFGQYNWILPRN